MGGLKLAVATKGSRGLEDEVSNVFGKAKTFTFIELEDDKIKNVEVRENPGASYEHGSGPVAGKVLSETGVKAVICGEFGPGALALLETSKIHPIKVEAGTKVSRAILVGEVKALAKETP